MSNQAVGGLYQAIIDEVINSSRVDFEESGVEESVLEELRQVSLLPASQASRPGVADEVKESRTEQRPSNHRQPYLAH